MKGVPKRRLWCRRPVPFCLLWRGSACPTLCPQDLTASPFSRALGACKEGTGASGVQGRGWDFQPSYACYLELSRCSVSIDICWLDCRKSKKEIVLFFKGGKGLERQLHGWERWLLVQKTLAQIPAPISESLLLPVTPGPREPMPSPGFSGHLHTW